jgi:type II secretory pathway component PulM
MNKIKQWLADRPPRERLMILGLFATFTVLGSIIAVAEFSAAFAEREEQIVAMREALSLIRENQTSFLAARARKAALDEKLTNQSFKPKTFIREQGTALGLSVNVTDGTRRPDVQELDIEVNFDQIDYNDLTQYLDAISSADAPLYVKTLSITRRSTGRRTSATQDPEAAAKTPLNVSMTIVTFDTAPAPASPR